MRSVRISHWALETRVNPLEQRQRRGQSCRAGARRLDLASEPVVQSHAVIPVAATIDVFDCAQVHDAMPAELDEGITTEPVRSFARLCIKNQPSV